MIFLTREILVSTLFWIPGKRLFSRPFLFSESDARKHRFQDLYLCRYWDRLHFLWMTLPGCQVKKCTTCRERSPCLIQSSSFKTSLGTFPRNRCKDVFRTSLRLANAKELHCMSTDACVQAVARLFFQKKAETVFSVYQEETRTIFFHPPEGELRIPLKNLSSRQSLRKRYIPNRPFIRRVSWYMVREERTETAFSWVFTLP